MQQIYEGIEKFQSSLFPFMRERFETLSHGQEPHTLFITCCDSRVVPNLITQTLPGELFVCRTIGNIVPPANSEESSVAAAIEYAASALKVANIVVCGHSDCGAMKAVLNPDKLTNLPSTKTWLQYAANVTGDPAFRSQSEEEKLRGLIELNVIAQVQNVRSHPAVAASAITVTGLVYDIASAMVSKVELSHRLQGAA